MAKKKRSPYLSQAQLAAVVRYTPEQDAVAALLRQAQQNYRMNLSTARALSGTQDVIDRARPGIEQIYSDAGLSPSPVPAPALPAGALDLRSAATFEQAAGQHRLGEARAAELSNLADQRLAAHAAGVYGTANARKQLQQDVTDVLSKQQSLGREKGAFIASTVLDLENQAAGRRVTKRGQTLSHQDRVASRQQSDRNSKRSAGIDPATGKPIPGGKLDPKKKGKGRLPGGAKQLPQSMQNTVVENIRSVAALVHDQVGKPVADDVTLPDGTVIKKGQRLTSHAARQLLGTAHNPIGKAFSQTEINAGFDVAAYKGLSRPNVVALHRAGVRVKGRFRILPSGPLTAQQKKGLNEGILAFGG